VLVHAIEVEVPLGDRPLDLLRGEPALQERRHELDPEDVGGSDGCPLRFEYPMPTSHSMRSGEAPASAASSAREKALLIPAL
jgi:hypothetical protein